MPRNRTLPVTLLLLTSLAAGCGGPAPSSADARAASSDEATQAPDQTPAELGDAIGALYVEAIESVAHEVAQRPDPEVLRPKLESMKATYVAELVALGRAREDLEAADRATVDGAVRRAVTKIPSATFTTYAEGQNHYLETDRELADLIASFNVITQYANFDLLQKQAPDEAERLGIQ